MKAISVIMPALNEEKNILDAIESVLKDFETCNIKGEVLVINDGSTDRTEDLVNSAIKKDARIRMIKHLNPRGIGVSFWEGVDNAGSEAVVLLPGDNENVGVEIFRYAKLLEDVDMVLPFVYNRKVRSRFRNALSWLYCRIINATFSLNFKYTNGTVLYRRSILAQLDYRCTMGFFYQTDILVRLAKRGYFFVEVPYRLRGRAGGASKAFNLPSLLRVIKGYFRLVKDIYLKKGPKAGLNLAQDSVSFIRRAGST